jgi:chorismate mutase/prephenate dehydratase
MTLQQLRSKIDVIDRQLLALLNQRARLVKRVGSVKRVTGHAVFDPDREQALLEALDRRNKGPLDASSLRAIYREILSSSRMMQKQLRVAYLGPEGTYCHQAALERFGSSDLYNPCRTIPEIFATVSREESEVGVVPVENSTEGGVSASLDSLAVTELTICGEVYLKINHVLAGVEKNGPVEKIYSHPQALAQVRQWLSVHLPQAVQVEVSSTSEGARRAAAEARTAAVISPFAARLYGLDVLHRHISDSAVNTTRFLVVGRHKCQPTRRDKTSLLFAVSHEVGALSQVLAILSQHKLNMQKIESRPSKHKAWEYLFFVDVAGHQDREPFRRALAQIRKKTLWMKILGSYPDTTPHA